MRMTTGEFFNDRTEVVQTRQITRRDRLTIVVLSVVISIFALRPFIAELSVWRGDQYSDRHQYRDALRSYRKAALLAPDNAEVRGSMGFIYHRLGRPRAAIREYRRAVASDAGNAERHYDLGIELLSARKHRHALKHLEISRDIDPVNFAAYRGLIALYKKFGKNEQAHRATAQMERGRVRGREER